MIDAKITAITHHENKVVLTIEINDNNFKEICKKLKNGYPLVEHRSLLPIGRSDYAKVTENKLICKINIPRGIHLNNHSYQSTDDVINAIRAKIITEVSIQDGYIKLGTYNK